MSMTATLSPAELLHLRMLAQGLIEPRETDAGEAAPDARGSASQRIAATTRRMLALQGQDWRSARWALGERTFGTTAHDVHDAFNERLIVRSWPMRGTIHIVAAEDIAWMQQATNRRVLAGAPKRRAFLGMSDAVLDRLVEVSVEALRGGASLDRDEIAAVWTEAGIEWQTNWRYHLIWWLCQNGLAVFGPVGDTGEPRLVSAGEWIANPRTLDGDAALAELAARYASARGAVTAKDFAWWTGLTAGEAKRGIAAASDDGRLVEVRVCDPGSSVATPGKAALWADPAMLDRAASSRSSGHDADQTWHLLPAFDEHLLGYQDREPQLAEEHFSRIVPGRNGMFLATVVHEGTVVGTWKRGRRKGEGLIGTPLPGATIDTSSRALQLEAERWARFHGLSDISFQVPNTR